MNSARKQCKINETAQSVFCKVLKNNVLKQVLAYFSQFFGVKKKKTCATPKHIFQINRYIKHILKKKKND